MDCSEHRACWRICDAIDESGLDGWVEDNKTIVFKALFLSDVILAGVDCMFQAKSGTGKACSFELRLLTSSKNPTESDAYWMSNIDWFHCSYT